MRDALFQRRRQHVLGRLRESWTSALELGIARCSNGLLCDFIPSDHSLQDTRGTYNCDILK